MTEFAVGAVVAKIGSPDKYVVMGVPTDNNGYYTLVVCSKIDIGATWNMYKDDVEANYVEIDWPGDSDE